MLKRIVCVICPVSCKIEVDVEGDQILQIQGNQCDKGLAYAKQEISNPMRNIASSVKVEGGSLPLVSVRLTQAIPKKAIFEVMDQIKALKVQAPVSCGQILLENVLDTGAHIMATKDVPSL